MRRRQSNVRSSSKRAITEDTLETAGDFLEKILNYIRDPIFVKDSRHRLILVNDAECDLAGRTREELLGKTDYDFFPKEQVDIFWQKDDEVLKTGKENINEEEITDAQGRRRTIVTKKTLYTDYTGNKYIVGIIRDITELKQTEKALRDTHDRLELRVKERTTELEAINRRLYLEIAERRQAEEASERYRLLAESSRDVIIFVRYSDGRILEANQAAIETYQYTHDELLCMNISGIRVPEDQSIVAEQMRQAYDNGILFETNHICKNGGVIPVEVNSRGASLNGERILMSVIRNITDRKKAEEALRTSEEKYRLVVENANDAIFIVQNEKIKFPNRQTIVITGYSEEELASVPFSRFIHQDDKELVVNRHRKRLQGQDVPATYSFKIVNKSGEISWVAASIVLVTWEGSPAALTFLRDITIQKKLEEQLLHARKMEAIGTLAGGIAHDFNNLLTGILGYTDLMLMQAEKSHPFHEKLKIIEQQVESGTELTKQLLGFARGGRYEVKAVNVNDLIIKTSDIFGRTKKEIHIHKKLRKDLYTIEADPGQIEQVLFNLYLNAWQAMTSGGRLYLESQNVILNEQQGHVYSIEPGTYIRISVTDTGVGIDSETQKRIFEPFFSTKSVGKGTGLGLASAYGIIKNHGGIINVYSEKGYGATFTIYLPASMKEAVETKPAEERLFTGDETILVVDDERVNIELMKALLEKLGYKILTAQSGKKAIELYKKHSKDIKLVILDMIMPEMNGKETLLRLMEIDKKVRVLLSSGYSINGEAAKILEMGCRGFIQKPFKVEELSWKIRTILDKGHS